MEFTLAQVLILTITSLIVGSFISYLFVKAQRVSRSSYDTLKENLGASQNELDTQKALVSHLSQDKEKIENHWQAEQEINRNQEKKISELTARYESLESIYNQEKEINQSQQTQINETQNHINNLTKLVATHEANNKSLLDKLDSQKEEIINIRRESELHFEKIANKLFEEKSSKFSKVNRENIEQILNPLHEKIKSFEDKVESSNKESINRHSSLKEMIKQYTDLSKKVGEDANNLAKALKGDYKKQGNWGEMVLQSILDKSGLEKDREYFIQKSIKNSEGKLQKPDVIIELPDNKRLIIDSKVSLVAYDSMVAADSKEEAEKHQKNHTLALKNHINGLAEKNYHDLYQVESPDFVMMFIPIDTAFSAALRFDPTLFDYAFTKNIIIVTASTLLATLKTVETIWKNDKQNRFALEIASEAGKMYDKFVGFAEDLEKMGNQLNTVQKTYNNSMNKLTVGAGNLVRRAQRIKELGANSNKTIPQKLLTTNFNFSK